MNRLDRRQFLRGSLAAGAVLALPSSRILGANNDIRLGVIGVGSRVKIGGMGRNEIAAYLKIPGMRFVALCDCDKANLMPEIEKLRSHNPSIKAYTDLRELLDDKNVDAVIVTTPNHWHALATIWACQAGKDVYVEKPPCYDCWEGRKMIEAARKYARIVQVGTQNRSAPYNMAAKKYIEEGKLGTIHFCRIFNQKDWGNFPAVPDSDPPQGLDWDMLNGPAPKAKYNAN
ncbi:MAG: Gfo/Idh/MocA family oxidoreductase, partial [Phycisphaerae bacterium]|nr:Gfo/Idh/MocA family oxidoreductase [Phycisphaerae bacterium]